MRKEIHLIIFGLGLYARGRAGKRSTKTEAGTRENCAQV
jgi:hypothetical protein